jgi:NitT/TauT family transport system permease protein
MSLRSTMGLMVGRGPSQGPGDRPPAAGVRPRDRARGTGVGRRATAFWRIREDLSRRSMLLLAVVSLLVPLLAWTLLVVTKAVDPIFLPSPVQVLRAAIEMVSSGILQADAWASVRRVALGFGLAFALSVPLGLAIGSFRGVGGLFEPAIGLVRYMPASAFIPLLLIWLGLGEQPKIALIVIGVVFFNTLMIANVVWQVPTDLIRVAFTLGATNTGVLTKVIFPYTLPGIIDAARVNLAAAWNLIVVAELVAADAGLGFRIVRAQKFLQIDQIFVVLIVIGLLGLTSDLLLRTARNRLAPWSQE